MEDSTLIYLLSKIFCSNKVVEKKSLCFFVYELLYFMMKIPKLMHAIMLIKIAKINANGFQLKIFYFLWNRLNFELAHIINFLFTDSSQQY